MISRSTIEFRHYVAVKNNTSELGKTLSFKRL